MEHVRLGEILL